MPITGLTKNVTAAHTMESVYGVPLRMVNVLSAITNFDNDSITYGENDRKRDRKKQTDRQQTLTKQQRERDRETETETEGKG